MGLKAKDVLSMDCSELEVIEQSTMLSVHDSAMVSLAKDAADGDGKALIDLLKLDAMEEMGLL